MLLLLVLLKRLFRSTFSLFFFFSKRVLLSGYSRPPTSLCLSFLTFTTFLYLIGQSCPVGTRVCCCCCYCCYSPRRFIRNRPLNAGNVSRCYTTKSSRIARYCLTATLRCHSYALHTPKRTGATSPECQVGLLLIRIGLAITPS